MSKKNVVKFLQGLGLSERETEIYLFLAKSGAQPVSLVARKLKIERVQAYHVFRRLQQKGFVEATLERPTRFTVVPLETLIESYITNKKNEIDMLEHQKADLLASWKSLSVQEPSYLFAKFSIITGRRKIYSKILKMIEESKKENFMLVTSLGVVQEDIAGIFDAIVQSAPRKNVQFKVLTSISQESLGIIERITKNTLTKNASIEFRHADLAFEFFPLFVTKDDEEALLYVLSGGELALLNAEDEGLWINDKMFVYVLKAFFTEMWRNAIDVGARIEELETGIPKPQTNIIRDPQEAQSKILKILDAAEEEVIAITSSTGVNKIPEADIFLKCFEKGLKCRIMAPIDLDNFEAAKKLSASGTLKHVGISYLKMMMVDNKHLFVFKSPPSDDLPVESVFYLPDTFYTNDPRSTEIVHEMLNDIWKRGIDMSEMSSQAGMKMPTVVVSSSDTVSTLVHKMLRNNVHSALITEKNTPIGIVSERDLLREIIEARKDPEKTCAKEIPHIPLVTVETDEPLMDALKAMREKGIKRMAIVKKGKLVGMLAEEINSRKPNTKIEPRV